MGVCTSVSMVLYVSMLVCLFEYVYVCVCVCVFGLVCLDLL